MAQPTGSSGGAITLEDLIALNDEMIALVRAGVPLEQGMRELGRDLPGKLGAISSGLAARIERGESLDQALAQSGFPPVYRAVAEAGIRAGRLAAALESLATSVRRLAELRRMVSLAILYPLVVFLLTYGLFVFMVAKVVPTLIANDWSRAHPRVLTWLERASGTLDIWGPVVPIVVISLSAIWWYRSRRAALAQSSLAMRYFGWVPSLRSVLWNGRAGGFCEILTVLVDHGVPLAEALRLAGRSSGDRAIDDSAERIASRIESGQPELERHELHFAPLLSWLLLTGQPRLVESLRFAAETYQRRAARQAEWLATYLPLIFTVVIGGAVTLLYATTLFLPWSMMMTEFAAP